MQTLKTGAIIVLLMTIVFSAYTSLTSPPDGLPDEVADALIFNDDGTFAIDDGLPPSLADMEFGTDPTTEAVATTAATAASNPAASLAIDTGVPAGSLGQPMADPTTLSVAAAANVGAGAGTAADPSAAGDGFNATFDDQSVAAITVGNSSGIATLSKAAPSDPAGSPSRYQSTDTRFTMPDPTQLDVGSFAAAPAIDPESGSPEPIAAAPNFAASAPVQTVSNRTETPGAAVEGRQISPPDPAINGPGPDQGLANAIQTADRQFGQGRLRDALATLSLFYSTPGIAPSQRSEMLSRLDYLAGNVIFSPRHLLETPHRVTPGQNLMTIAAQYSVPWQLLANINQVRDPSNLRPGSELKVVRGPMRAEVATEIGELTLFLGELYAGRFNVRPSGINRPRPGTYTVASKANGKAYTGPGGSTVPANDPSNPYGAGHIDLGNGVSLHGGAAAASADRPGASLTLSNDDVSDLLGILSLGSQVEVR